MQPINSIIFCNIAVTNNYQMHHCQKPQAASQKSEVRSKKFNMHDLKRQESKSDVAGTGLYKSQTPDSGLTID
jgi:hypothetical protein